MTLKELNIDDLRKLSILQLYNLLYGPIANEKKKVCDLNENAVVAVYGATIIPVERRLKALNDIIDNSFVKAIIFSGGIGWHGIQFNQMKDKQIIEEYKNSEVRKRIFNRAVEIFERCYGFKEVLYSEKKLYNKNNNIIDKVYKDNDFKKYMNSEFKKYLKKEYNDNKEIVKFLFNRWSNFIIDKKVFNYIIRNVTESEIMQILWNNTILNKKNDSSLKIKCVLDNESLNTYENALNCYKKFVELRKKIDNLNTMIVITEWPYLHRTILTTKKVFIDNGCSNINIIGYPAIYDKWNIGADWSYNNLNNFINGSIAGMIPNLRKEINYDDVADFEIDEFINYKGLYPNGPKIAVNGEIFKGDKVEIMK